MLKLLGRLVFLLIGATLVADGFLTPRIETLTVDQHTSRTDSGHSRAGGSNWGDTSYTLHFAGGTLRSCSVGYSAYHSVEDGSVVEVKSTRLFRNCTRITSGQDVLVQDDLWRVWQVGGGLLMIAVALGWIRSNGDEWDWD